MSTTVGQTIHISVGNAGINFTPNSTTAAVGDTLAFHFYDGTGPHSVVRSTFDLPCVPEVGTAEFYSGYLVGDAAGSQTYEITVTDTEPIWYYCSAKKHCQNGMVGVVNPPGNATVAEYAVAAKSVAAASSPSAPVGGTSTSMAATAGSTAAATTTSGGSGAGVTSATSAASAAATSATPGSAVKMGGASGALAALAVVAGALVAIVA